MRLNSSPASLCTSATCWGVIRSRSEVPESADAKGYLILWHDGAGRSETLVRVGKTLSAAVTTGSPCPS